MTMAYCPNVDTQTYILLYESLTCYNLIYNIPYVAGVGLGLELGRDPCSSEIHTVCHN